MPVGISTNTTIQAQTKVIEKAYLSETDRVPPQYKVIIPDLTSDEHRRFVTFLPYAGLSAFQEKVEGAAPAFDAPFEMIPFTAVFNTYALAATVTEEAELEDPIGLKGKLPRMLAKAERNTKDLQIANLLNLGFSLAVLGADGQPLFSSAHPLGPIATPTGVVSEMNQTFSNYLGATDLTPESNHQGEILAETILDDRGKKDKRTLRHLVVPTNLDKIAKEVLGTPYKPYTPDNTINTEYQALELFTWRDLTNPYAWFQLAAKGEPDSEDNDVHGLATWWKWQNKVNSWEDPMTSNFFIKSRYRFALGFWTWRGSIGSIGAGA
jgi:hypothetical protein